MERTIAIDDKLYKFEDCLTPLYESTGYQDVTEGCLDYNDPKIELLFDTEMEEKTLKSICKIGAYGTALGLAGMGVSAAVGIPLVYAAVPTAISASTWVGGKLGQFIVSASNRVLNSIIGENEKESL